MFVFGPGPDPENGRKRRHWAEKEHAIPDEQRLLTTLLKDYHMYSRPVFNASEKVVIKFGLTLVQISDMVRMTLLLIYHTVRMALLLYYDWVRMTLLLIYDTVRLALVQISKLVRLTFVLIYDMVRMPLLHIEDTVRMTLLFSPCLQL